LRAGASGAKLARRPPSKLRATLQPKPVRSFSRGLTVLEILNRHGSATALRLARESGIPRPTVYRLLQTLVDAGFVRRGLTDDRFHLRLAVRQLSSGFNDALWITAVATPLLFELTAQIAWTCDVLTLDGLSMVVRDTTHSVAPLAIDHHQVGAHLPMLGSASGLTYLAFTPANERKLLLDMLARSDSPHDALARDVDQVQRLIMATRRRGYGLRQGGVIWPNTGSIALPIRHNKRVLGCISAIWMARVIDFREGVQRCLEPLRETQALIERRLNAEEQWMVRAQVAEDLRA
jgi:IclR family mhp operon transcriptional activator